MLSSELKEFRLLKAISFHFPDAEIVRSDNSRKKLNSIFSDTEKKSTTEIFFQCPNYCEQSSFDFGEKSSKRGTI